MNVGLNYREGRGQAAEVGWGTECLGRARPQH